MNRIAGASATLLLLLASVSAGCTYADRNEPNRDLRNEWRQAADQHGAMGYAATFDVTGQPLAMLGDGLAADVAAPFSLRIGQGFPARDPYLYAAGATITGVGSGLLVLEAATLQVTAGSAGSLDLKSATTDGTSVALELARPTGHVEKPQAAFPEAWKGANESLFFADATGLSPAAWTLAGFDRGVLLTPSGPLDVTEPITVGATEVFWDASSRIDVSTGVLRADRFSLAGNVTTGRLDLDGHDDVERPLGIFGKDVEVRLTPTGARSQGTFRATQAITTGGLALAAAVQIVANEELLTVERGKEAWLSASYRESSYRADAALEDIEITGPGADLLSVPVQRPPWLVEELFAMLEEIADEAPWIAPFFAIPIVLSAPWIAMVDFVLAVMCAFSTCPDQYPYPIWMGAGDVGLFYVKATGDKPAGDYPATLTFTGQNHEAVTMTLTVRVVG